MIEMYVDGSCRGNGIENNSGGLGVVVFKDNKIDYYYSQQSENTTNNREEIKAIIHALELTQTKYKEEKCIIYSDSAYCVNMCNEWIWMWQSRGWKRAGNKDIENLDLVHQLYKYLTIPFNNFSIIKIKGHVGHLGNELADAAATGDKKKIDILKQENSDKFRETRFGE